MLPLAVAGDVAARLGRQLTTPEQVQVNDLIEESSFLVSSYLGAVRDEMDPDSDITRVVVSRMVARVLESAAPPEATSASESAGVFSRTVQFASGTTSRQPWLSRQDKIMLAPLRIGGGISSISAASNHTGRFRTDR